MNLEKKLSIGLSFLKKCVLRKKAPFSVNFKITNRCNRNCQYCNYPSNETQEMTTAQIISMINQFKKMGMRKLSINGGEPLLREDLGEIVAHTSYNNIITIITSNGDLVKKKIGALKDLDYLTLSLDGPPDVHNRLRGEGSYENVVEAIEIAKKAGLKTNALVVLSRQNIDSLDSIFSLSERMKFSLSFQPAFFYSFSQKREEDFRPEKSKWNRCIENIIKKKKEGKLILNTESYLNNLLDWPIYPRQKCWAGYFFCSVDPSGYVYPCTKFFGYSKFLNGNKVGFKEAFSNIAPYSCEGCWAACFNEYNSLFSLRLGSIASAASNL